MGIPASIFTTKSMTSWILLLALTIAIADACFIRNCPKGGKRSFLSGGADQTWSKHKCLSCGPEGLGQCVGPNICCGQSIGCYVNTVETEVCSRENNNPVPCQVNGERCGSHLEGNCVASGICCSDVKCTLDSSCNALSPRDLRSGDVSKMTSPESHFSASQQYVFSPDLEDYIRRLLRIQELEDNDK